MDDKTKNDTKNIIVDPTRCISCQNITSGHILKRMDFASKLFKCCSVCYQNEWPWKTLLKCRACKIKCHKECFIQLDKKCPLYNGCIEKEPEVNNDSTIAKVNKEDVLPEIQLSDSLLNLTISDLPASSSFDDKITAMDTTAKPNSVTSTPESETCILFSKPDDGSITIITDHFIPAPSTSKSITSSSSTPYISSFVSAGKVTTSVTDNTKPKSSTTKHSKSCANLSSATCDSSSTTDNDITKIINDNPIPAFSNPEPATFLFSSTCISSLTPDSESTTTIVDSIPSLSSS